MMMNVAARDSGIEIADTSVDRIDARNTRITSTANSRPSPPSVDSPSMDSSMNGAWSNTTPTVTSRAASVADRSSSACCTACDTSTVLPSGVFVIAMPSDGSPSSRAAEVAGTGSPFTAPT
jgi:hypothetical protein